MTSVINSQLLYQYNQDNCLLITLSSLKLVYMEPKRRCEMETSICYHVYLSKSCLKAWKKSKLKKKAVFIVLTYTKCYKCLPFVYSSFCMGTSGVIGFGVLRVLTGK